MFNWRYHLLRLLTGRQTALLAGGVIAMMLVAFMALETGVSAQTPTGTAAPPKATATTGTGPAATPTAAATTPAATTPAATAAAPKATTAAATPAATPAATKAAESASNTTMYLLIGVGAIVVIGGAWYMMKGRS